MGEHLVPGPLGEGLPGLAPADSQPCLSTATTNGETGFPSGLPGSDSTGVSVLLLLGKLSPPHPGEVFCITLAHRDLGPKQPWKCVPKFLATIL